MTTTISPPIRILALVGVLALIGVGLLVYGRSHSSTNEAAITPTAHPRTQVKTLHASTSGPVKSFHAPKVTLVPGLPLPVAHALHYSNVVVVGLFTSGAGGDQQALAEARLGAKEAHAGFAAVNVLHEPDARLLNTFAGVASTPAVLIVRRPGHIMNRFDGFTDNVVVAQAAQNAGAGASH